MDSAPLQDSLYTTLAQQLVPNELALSTAEGFDFAYWLTR